MRSILRVGAQYLLLFAAMQFSNWVVFLVHTDQIPPHIQQVEAEGGPLPTPSPSPSVSIEHLKLYAYFSKFNCPITDLVDEFLDVARDNGLDWRLLPAISMQESTCGKAMAGNNAFGFGYENFDSVSAALNKVGSAISGDNTKDGGYYRGANKDSAAILRVYNKRPGYPGDVLAKMSDIDTSY